MTEARIGVEIAMLRAYLNMRAKLDDDIIGMLANIPQSEAARHASIIERQQS